MCSSHITSSKSLEVLNFGAFVMKAVREWGHTMEFDFYVRTKQDLIDAVQTFGIVPYFSASIPGFSLAEHCHPSALWSDDGEDSRA